MRVPILQHPVPRLSGLIRNLRFAGTMIFRIKAYWRSCVSSAYWLCVRRHASSPLVSDAERTRVRTLLFVIRPASSKSVCCMQRDRVLFSASHRSRSCCETGPTRVMWIWKQKRKFWYSASVPSNVGGLPRLRKSLSSSTSRGFAVRNCTSATLLRNPV